MRRVARLIVGVTALAACRPVGLPPEQEVGAATTGGQEDEPTFHVLDRLARPQLDVIVVVDGQPGTEQLQSALGDRLAAIALIPQVDLRIAFVGAELGNPACAEAPLDRELQLEACATRPEHFPRVDPERLDPFIVACGVCPQFGSALRTVPTTTLRDPQPRSRAWLQFDNGSNELPFGNNIDPQSGYDPVSAVRCATPRGTDGCAFSSPLGAVMELLDQSEIPGDPAFDFIRPDASLHIIVATTSADCGVHPKWQGVFLPEGSRALWSSPEDDAPTPALCWRAGVRCEGGPGTYASCSPADVRADGTMAEGPDDAVMTRVEEIIERLEALRAAKRERDETLSVHMTWIGGVPTDFSSGAGLVYRDADGAEEQAEFGVAPGCAGEDLSARPPVRGLAVARALADDEGSSDGTPAVPDVLSACRTGWPELATLAGAAERPTAACVPECVEDLRPSELGLQPACVVEIRSVVGGVERRTPVSRCGGTLPCYEIRWDAQGDTPSTDDDLSDVCVEAGWNAEIDLVTAGDEFDGVLVAACTPAAEPAIRCPNR